MSSFATLPNDLSVESPVKGMVIHSPSHNKCSFAYCSTSSARKSEVFDWRPYQGISIDIARNNDELTSLSNIAQDVIRANNELEKYKRVRSEIWEFTSTVPSVNFYNP